ncbi:hypothetical protein BDN70DRAFT_403172 [Pholiota conissans]|uniref:Uncharacterized protein n=1 Tax=Pholiota conissans TaxID=109636 RepID=A0A9P6D4K3_9AGAR|nr:hypothetical protein BDN70DRAFT_403172 [Pholiota conissans]
MFTSKKPALRYIPHPSPGGGRAANPSTPPRFQPYQATSSPRKIHMGNPTPPSTPSRGHRISLRGPQAPVTPVRPAPRRVGASPALARVNQALAQTRPAAEKDPEPRDSKFFGELDHLKVVHSFDALLEAARNDVELASIQAPHFNAKIEAQSEYQHGDVSSRPLSMRERVHLRKQVKRELSERNSFERRSKRQRDEDSLARRRTQKKARMAEREERRVKVERRDEARPQRSPTPTPASPQPGPSQAQQQAEAARQAAELQAAERHAAELQAAERAAQEEARLQAHRAQEAKQQAEEKVALDLALSMAQKARRRLEEETKRCEEACRQMEEEIALKNAQAEKDLKQADEAERLARRQLDETLRVLQEEAQLLEAERAQINALCAQHEAYLKAEHRAFLHRQDEHRRILEQAELSIEERRARLAQIERAQHQAEESMHARIQQFANLTGEQFATFFRQEAQRIAEEEASRCAAEEAFARQHYQNTTPQADHAAHKQQPPQRDFSMREPSLADVSMHSIPDSMSFTDDPPTPRMSSASPPPPPTPSPPPGPASPPTVAELFALWGKKWEYIDSHADLRNVDHRGLPWPTLRNIETTNDITIEHIAEFLSHSDCPPRLSARKLIALYHSDKFKFRVTNKLSLDQQALAEQMANHCTILLVNHMR